MPFMDDFSKVAKQVAKEANHAVGKARKQAGQVTDANFHKISDAIDKAGKFVDSKTDGKYHKHVEKAKHAAGKGVEFVAAQKSAHVPPRPGRPREEATPSGPSASWQDTSVQDSVPHLDNAPPVGENPYPNPIPPYTPPTH